MEGWNGDDAVFHFGTEEAGGGGYDFFGARVLVELDVVEHEAELLFSR